MTDHAARVACVVLQMAAAADPASVKWMTIVITAASTLVVTIIASVVVQAVLVPAVQARTRRRERWEEQLNQLWDLITDQLQRSVDEFRLTAVGERHLAQVIKAGLPIDKQERADEEMRKRYDERRAAQEAVEKQLTSVVLLAARLGRVQPRSRYWAQVDGRVLAYRYHLPNYLWAAGGLFDPQDDEALDKLWEEQDDAREVLIKLLEPTVDRQAPPRQHPLDRWPWLRRWLGSGPDHGVPPGLL